MMEKKDLINKFAEKGYLLAPELLQALVSEKSEAILTFLEFIEKQKDKPLVLTSEFFLRITAKTVDELQANIEVKKIQQEIKTPETTQIRSRTEVKVQEVQEQKVEDGFMVEGGIRILYSHTREGKEITVDDFSSYFRNRYFKLRELISSRPELKNLVSINKLGSQREDVSVIGMIQEKRITKNGNLFLNIEDVTGNVKVIASNKNKKIFEKAEDLTYDEVVGIRGNGNNEFIFANEIVQPGFFGKERKQGGKDYALFISDLHVGSNKFLEKEFKAFIKWLNLQTAGKNKEIAEKCKYLFVLGDLVDGVGIYPGQEKELAIKNIRDQYDEAAYLLSQIRDDVKILAIPGNHDASSAAIPQPVFDKKYASSLYKLKNLLMLSNPAYVNIASNKDFAGYDVMLYHGYSFHHSANNIRSLVNKGYKNPELLLTHLLKKRHLAPTHGSTPYVPLKQDPLLIERVPDVLATGELHKLSASYHNNVALITCSCWQGKTSYQIKVGQEPDICKVPALDLAKNSLKILDFS